MKERDDSAGRMQREVCLNMAVRVMAYGETERSEIRGGSDESRDDKAPAGK